MAFEPGLECREYFKVRDGDGKRGSSLGRRIGVHKGGEAGMVSRVETCLV